MSKYAVFGGTVYNLGSSIGSTDTSITLSSFLEPVTGTPYTMALLNTDICYGTIAPKTTSSEFISFTGITQNADGSATLTGVVRGLAKKYPFTSSSSYMLPHSGQTQFIISDAPQVFNEYVTLHNAETIDAVKTFSVSPVVPTGGTGTQAANATDIANAVTGASGTATNLVAGTTKLSVAAAVGSNPIAVGDNDTRVPTINTSGLTAAQLLALPGDNTDIAVGSGNKYVTQTGLQNKQETYVASTGSANAYLVTYSPAPVALLAGQEFEFKANFTNTGAATLTVLGLGAIAIKKLDGATALIAGDIVSGQIVKVKYDGTNFQMLNPTGTVSANSYQTGFIQNTSTTAKNTDNAFTTGFLPKIITIYFDLQGTTSATQKFSSGIAIFDGTSLVQILSMYGNQSASTTITQAMAGINRQSSPSAGNLSGNDIRIELSVLSISSTGFTIRSAFTITGSPGSAAANYVAVATQ